MRPKAILTAAVLLIVLIIIFQNREVVQFDLLFWKISMSRIIWFLVILVAGFAAGFLAGSRGPGRGR